MTRSFLQYVVFAAGLAVVAWVGAGYAQSNLLALAVTLLIGAVYLAGALELWSYRAATQTLTLAVSNLSQAPASLETWLESLHVSLRNAARRRVEGARAALPGPGLTPYLAGLLVLLGMLGTFLGMIATLRGTSLALETGTDLQAIRDSLAAPVKGLGFAFGTSVAGVAASAMLGLLSALCQRERARAAQGLDARIATTLRGFSSANQREETFNLLRKQADALPALADRMQAMMASMEQQTRALNAQLLGGHETLSASLSANQTALHERIAASQEALYQSLSASQNTLHQSLSANQEALQQKLSSSQDAWRQSLSASQEAFQARTEAAYAQLADCAARSLQDSAAASARAAGEAIQPAVQAALAGMTRDTQAWRDDLTRSTREQVEGLVEGFSQTTARITNDLSQASTQIADGLSQTTARMDERLDKHALSLAQRASTLLDALEQSHAALRARLAEHDEQRFARYAQQLDTQTDALRQGWEQAHAHANRQHQQLCETLARTADHIAAQSETRTQGTLAEIARLMQAAEQAPQAVADVIAELRRKQSEGIERDNAMLQERARLLETLGALLDTVNQSATRQREAIDALITASGEKLETLSTRFAETTQSHASKLAEAAETQTSKLTQLATVETDKLAEAAAQITASANQTYTLGAELGAALQSFSLSNTALTEQLQRIETALDKSMTRGDEQLAYYVAQAREVVDLSLLSQKQILEDLRRLPDVQGNL